MQQLLNSHTPEYQKILLLTNLMKIDGFSDRSEKAFIEAYIAQYTFEPEALNSLKEAIQNPQMAEVNLEIIKQHPSEAKATLVLMVALSREDGTVHELEKKYIYEICQVLGFDKREVDNHFNGITC
ncbi:MAG: TerB family tellurite resistance protein [Bacteroidia bacterium]|nr:TerB family tellurite resistance protein [Bacteroidia bacterium]MDW8157965.1 TerB family tellurite resistance protein [Bacteroidia bacterium]